MRVCGGDDQVEGGGFPNVFFPVRSGSDLHCAFLTLFHRGLVAIRLPSTAPPTAGGYTGVEDNLEVTGFGRDAGVLELLQPGNWFAKSGGFLCVGFPIFGFGECLFEHFVFFRRALTACWSNQHNTVIGSNSNRWWIPFYLTCSRLHQKIIIVIFRLQHFIPTTTRNHHSLLWYPLPRPRFRHTPPNSPNKHPSPNSFSNDVEPPP